MSNNEEDELPDLPSLNILEFSMTNNSLYDQPEYFYPEIWDNMLLFLQRWFLYLSALKQLVETDISTFNENYTNNITQLLEDQAAALDEAKETLAAETEELLIERGIDISEYEEILNASNFPAPSDADSGKLLIWQDDRYILSDLSDLLSDIVFDGGEY